MDINREAGEINWRGLNRLNAHPERDEERFWGICIDSCEFREGGAADKWAIGESEVFRSRLSLSAGNGDALL